MVACVVPQFPAASFLEDDEGEGFAGDVGGLAPDLSRAWTARPVVSMAALGPVA